MQKLNLELDDGLVEVLHSLGNLGEIVQFALKRYSIDEILRRTEELKKEITEWEMKYNMSYDQFQAKVVKDNNGLPLAPDGLANPSFWLGFANPSRAF